MRLGCWLGLKHNTYVYFFGFGIAKLTSNLIRNCCKVRKDTKQNWTKGREKIFGEQKNFLWLSWQNKDFLFSMGIYSYPFIYCISIKFLAIPFSFILLSHYFSSMKFHYSPLSSLWTGFSMLQFSWEAIFTAQQSCNIWFSSHEFSSQSLISAQICW